MEEKKYYIIGMEGTDNIVNECFNEVRLGRVQAAEFYMPYSFKHKLSYWLFRVRYYKKTRVITRKLNSYIYSKRYVLNSIELDPSCSNIIIIVPGCDLEKYIDIDYFDKYKRKHENVKLVLWLVDSIDANQERLGFCKWSDYYKVFDYVATYDRLEADKYGIHFLNMPFSYLPDGEYIPEKNKIDLFFIGNEKGRYKELVEISEYLTKRGVKCLFIIKDRLLYFKRRQNGIVITNKRVVYKEVLHLIKESKCILEILCDGQYESSLRYYEAVVYEKKLLTNNPEIKNKEFYDPRFMKWFKEVGDIDCNWITMNETVDYNYDGRYQIESFFESVNNIIK